MSSELPKLRRAQTKRVMAQIGPLLDAWEGLPGDARSSLEEDSPAFVSAMEGISEAVEGDDE